MSTREKYQPPPPHKWDDSWTKDLDETHKILHEMAKQMLGSSYFGDRTHGLSKIAKQTIKAQSQ